MGNAVPGAKYTREVRTVDCSAHRAWLWVILVYSEKTEAIRGGGSEGKQEALTHSDESGMRKGRLERWDGAEGRRL